MTDLAKKILLTGVGAIFMTEDAIRKTLSDLKMPTDSVGGVMDALKKQKDEMLKLVAVELSNFLGKVKVHEELQKALKGLHVHLNADISFDRKGDKTQAKVTIKKED